MNESESHSNYSSVYVPSSPSTPPDIIGWWNVESQQHYLQGEIVGKPIVQIMFSLLTESVSTPQTILTSDSDTSLTHPICWEAFKWRSDCTDKEYSKIMTTIVLIPVLLGPSFAIMLLLLWVSMWWDKWCANPKTVSHPIISLAGLTCVFLVLWHVSHVSVSFLPYFLTWVMFI